MIKGMCLVCNDEHKFNIAINNVQNMIFQLKKIVKTKEVKNENFYHLFYQFQKDSKHIHFKCGTCQKVNEMQLKNLEKELDEILTTICFQIKSKDTIYFKVLRILQGHYPLKYKIFEKYFLTKLEK